MLTDKKREDILQIAKALGAEVIKWPSGDKIYWRAKYWSVQNNAYSTIVGNDSEDEAWYNVALMLAAHVDQFEWMIAVVEIFERSDFGFKMCRKRVDVYRDSTKDNILSVKLTNRRESLFQALADFCKWFNREKMEAINPKM